MAPEDLVTEDILTAALAKDFGNGVRIVSWNSKPCSETEANFFNVVKRIFVTYEREGLRNTVSYVAKLNPCKGGEDTFNPYRQRAMEKEVFFYDTLLPLLNSQLKTKGGTELRVPKYLHSSVEPRREVIILEDLQKRGFETSRIREMDEAHSALIAKEIGRLHLASLGLQKIRDMKDLESSFPLLVESWLVGDQRLREAFEHVFTRGVKMNSRLASVLEGFKNASIVDQLKGKEMQTLAGELRPDHQWKVICHGDIHRTNVLFRYDEEQIPVEIMLLDWQTVRVATLASEITYLLFSSFFGEHRDRYLPIILEHYYKTLGSSAQFSYEKLEKEVKHNAFGLLICFYLVPLSLTVDNPSELFKFSEEKEMTEEEATQLLNNNPTLKTILCDYLKALNSKSHLF